MVLRILLCSILSSLCVCTAVGQDIDRQLQKLSWDGEELNTFAQMIAGDAQSDREKLTRIYHWIIYHIRYDYEAVRSKRWRINQDSKDILTRGKALCWGYASLLKDFLNEVEIPSVVVSGYSRGLSTSRSDPREPDHAWNAVQISGEWQLVDATWDSGLYHSGGGFSDSGKPYFLTPPVDFLQTHIPAQPMWQLLTRPLSMQQFNEKKFELDTTTYFDFRDSISGFLAMSKMEQLLVGAAMQYRFHPTVKNREDLCHANIDYAIFLKEKADSLSGEGEDQMAVDNYFSALTYFDRARSGIEPYDWQTEAQAFCHLNLAQGLYRLKGTNNGLDDVIIHLKKAKGYLEHIASPSSMVKSALQFIEQNLEMLE